METADPHCKGQGWMKTAGPHCKGQGWMDGDSWSTLQGTGMDGDSWSTLQGTGMDGDSWSTLQRTGMDGWRQPVYHIWSAAWQGRGTWRFEELSQHGQARAKQHDRLKERGVEKGPFTLQGRERSVFNQTNIGTVSRATLGRLLRDGARKGLSERYDAILN